MFLLYVLGIKSDPGSLSRSLLSQFLPHRAKNLQRADAFALQSRKSVNEVIVEAISAGFCLRRNENTDNWKLNELRVSVVIPRL